MKKWLAVGSLVVSMSYIGASYAEPVSSSEAATGVAIAAGVGAVAATSVVAGVFAGGSSAYYINEEKFTTCPDAQTACDAAYFGTYTGAGLGTLWGIACLAVEGANLVGLASIGSMVGGGVMAGAATVVAAPAIAAAVVGGATYWVVKDWDSIESLWAEKVTATPVATTPAPVTPAPADPATTPAPVAAPAAQ
ncbi:MAG: hypothetical protein KAG43_06190 [Candidatus Marithrix sp.]|nr:hypothetical protein [Candidatus Marithrix sp.]